MSKDGLLQQYQFTVILLHIMKGLGTKERTRIAYAGRSGHNSTSAAHMQEYTECTYGATNAKSSWHLMRCLAPLRGWQFLQSGHGVEVVEGDSIEE